MRYLKRAVLVVCGLILLFVAAGIFLMNDPTRLANWSLSQWKGPYRVEIGKIEKINASELTFSDLRVTHRIDGELIAQLPAVRIAFDLNRIREKGMGGVSAVNLSDGRISFSPPGFPRLEMHLDVREKDGVHEAIVRNLRTSGEEALQLKIPNGVVRFTTEGLAAGHVASVVLEKPDLQFDLKFLKNLQSGTEQNGVAWSADRINIVDGRIRIQGEGVPEVEAIVDVKNAEGTAAWEIVLRDVRVGEKDAALLLAKRLEIVASAEGVKAGHVEVIQLDGAEINLNEKFLKTVEGLQGRGETSEASESWSVGTLQIANTTVQGKGLGEKIPVFRVSIGAEWHDVSAASVAAQTLVLSDLTLATPLLPDKPFLAAESITLTASPVALLQQHEVETVAVEGAHFSYDSNFRAWMIPSSEPSPSTEPLTGKSPWKINTFSIGKSRVRIEDLGFGIPGIDFALRTKLSNLTQGISKDAGLEKIETVELTDLTIHSPLDPFSPVLNFQSIFIRFSIEGLMKRELEELVILYPTIFVGEDLFWYVDEIKKRSATEEKIQTTADEQSDWQLKHFAASYGRLIIAQAGAAKVPLPLNFSTEADNINFRSINDLQLKLNLVVPKEDYAFPAYQLELDDLFGNIEFGLPPKSGANNINNTLYSARTRWRQFLGQEVWLSVTYDLLGVNGKFGGFLYGGYLDGGFSFFLRDEVPWTGWLSATGVDMKAFTNVLAPENFQMSGPADFKIEINATGPRVERVIGSFKGKSPGHLNIAKLDAIIESLPGDWSALKQDITRIGLETLQNFDYDKGGADFWFLDGQGRLDLDLTGPTGSRRFSVFLHGDLPNNNSLWQTSQNIFQSQ